MFRMKLPRPYNLVNLRVVAHIYKFTSIGICTDKFANLDLFSASSDVNDVNFQTKTDNLY